MGQWGGGLILVLVAAAWAIPGAAAAAVEGSLLVESGFALPAGSQASLAPLGALHAGPESGVSLALSSPSVEVLLVEKRLAALPLARVETGHEVRSWRLTDVEIASVPGDDARGHVAYEPGPGARLDLLASLPAAIERRSVTAFSSDAREGTLGEQDARSTEYWREIRGDHVHLAAPGLLEASGGASLRVQGLDLAIRARENVTAVWTGERAAGPGEVVVRWVVLRFDAGDVRLLSDASALEVVAASAPRLAWSGTVDFVAVDGRLRAADAEYAAVGPFRLDGDFAAALAPGEGDLLHLTRLDGTLRATSLAPHARAPAAPAPAAYALPLAFLLGAALSAGAVLGVQALRRRPPRLPPPTAADLHEDCLAWAAFFEEQEDPEAALECLQAARAYADDDEYDVLLWEASCFDRLGRLEAALDRYEAAIAAAPKGDCEAAFAAAIVAAQLGRDEPALTHLRLSLMADPFLLEVVDALVASEEDPFTGLRRRPAFRQLLRDARGWARSASELS